MPNEGESMTKNTSLNYIKQWQEALGAEIAHLKNRGNTKYSILNGQPLSGGKEHAYYFETKQQIHIPTGVMVKIQWGKIELEGRLLSSEGKSVIVSLEQKIGDFMSEAYLLYEPWQLLEELSLRLDEIKKSGRKRNRIKRLLNPDQPSNHIVKNGDSKVKELYARSAKNPVTYVWGPPGTGKTYTLARVAANKYMKGMKVLLLAQSNAAVDLLMHEIYRFLVRKKKFTEGELLRYGKISLMDLAGIPITMDHLLAQEAPGLSKEKETLILERRLLKEDLLKSYSDRDSQELLRIENSIAAIFEKTRKKEKEMLAKAILIGTTLAKAASDPSIYEDSYDLVIIDEASMCYVPQAAFAASLGKRVIVCGDFKQLPPIAQSRSSSVSEWLKQDIFTKSGVAASVEKGNLHPHLFLLDEQRRMHPDISAFTNRYVYHSLVHDHKSVQESRNDTVLMQPFAGKASVLLDTSYTGSWCTTARLSKSRWNPWHLLLSFQLVQEAYTAGARSIGYVTPYRIQADLMNVLVKEFFPQSSARGEITAATVHKFQGNEKDIVIFDSVDSGPQYRPGMLLAGKESERLINVAITRTKGKFIHVAAADFIKRTTGAAATINQLVTFQQQKRQSIGHHAIGTWVQNMFTGVKWYHSLKKELVAQDILQAKESLIIGIPVGTSLGEDYVTLLEKVQNVKQHFLTEAALPFPFILIDRHWLWLGQPFECMLQNRPPFVSVRVESRSFAEEFLSQLPIGEKI